MCTVYALHSCISIFRTKKCFGQYFAWLVQSIAKHQQLQFCIRVLFAFFDIESGLWKQYTPKQMRKWIFFIANICVTVVFSLLNSIHVILYQIHVLVAVVPATLWISCGFKWKGPFKSSIYSPTHTLCRCWLYFPHIHALYAMCIKAYNIYTERAHARTIPKYVWNRHSSMRERV